MVISACMQFASVVSVWLFFGAAPAGSRSLSRTTVRVLFIRADFISLSSLSQSRLGSEELLFLASPASCYSSTTGKELAPVEVSPKRASELTGDSNPCSASPDAERGRRVRDAKAKP